MNEIWILKTFEISSSKTVDTICVVRKKKVSVSNLCKDKSDCKDSLYKHRNDKRNYRKGICNHPLCPHYLKKEKNRKFIYVYNYEGIHYRVFNSIEEKRKFFNDDDCTYEEFEDDDTLDDYLLNVVF